MTTREFIEKKNKIVYDVTGVILVPDNQIVDESPVKLHVTDSYDFLYSGICPYCMSRVHDGRVNCNDCPMKIAGNRCDDINDTNEESTWSRANNLWYEKANDEDKDKLHKLVDEYNKQFEEGD